jgi:hypothetical protein
MRPVKLNVFCVLFTSWYRDLFLVCNFPTLLSEAIIDIISYLCVYPWALKLYHPDALLYSLRRSRRLYSVAEGWYNLNALG